MTSGLRWIAEEAMANDAAADEDFAFDHAFFPIEVGHIRALVARGWLRSERP